MIKRNFITLFILIEVLQIIISACGTGNSKFNFIETPTSIMQTPTPDYIIDCKKLYGTKTNSQFSFNGISIGNTTSTEVEEIIGKPIKTSILREWSYDGFSILFDKDNKVEAITFIGDFLITTKNLDNLLLTYGCPDLLIKIDLDEEPSGIFDAIKLSYIKLGLEVIFHEIPLNLESKPELVILRKEELLLDYLDNLGIYDNANKFQLAHWYEVIQQQ